MLAAAISSSRFCDNSWAKLASRRADSFCGFAKALAKFTAACQRVSLLPRKRRTNSCGLLLPCTNHWTNSQPMTKMATIKNGMTNNCTKNPALGGSTAGKA